MSKSQHWYDKDGNAVFEVAKAKGGGMRATTIADARKLNLYPLLDWLKRFACY